MPGHREEIPEASSPLHSQAGHTPKTAIPEVEILPVAQKVIPLVDLADDSDSEDDDKIYEEIDNHYEEECLAEEKV